MTMAGKILTAVCGIALIVAASLLWQHHQLRNHGARYSAGYRAALAGIPVDACPHSNSDRDAWMEGWILGFQRRKEMEK